MTLITVSLFFLLNFLLVLLAVELLINKRMNHMEGPIKDKGEVLSLFTLCKYQFSILLSVYFHVISFYTLSNTFYSFRVI